MSSSNPPYPYYNGIPYNPSYFSTGTGSGSESSQTSTMDKPITIGYIPSAITSPSMIGYFTNYVASGSIPSTMDFIYPSYINNTPIGVYQIIVTLKVTLLNTALNNIQYRVNYTGTSGNTSPIDNNCLFPQSGTNTSMTASCVFVIQDAVNSFTFTASATPYGQAILSGSKLTLLRIA